MVTNQKAIVRKFNLDQAETIYLIATEQLENFETLGKQKAFEKISDPSKLSERMDEFLQTLPAGYGDVLRLDADGEADAAIAVRLNFTTGKVRYIRSSAYRTLKRPLSLYQLHYGSGERAYHADQIKSRLRNGHKVGIDEVPFADWVKHLLVYHGISTVNQLLENTGPELATKRLFGQKAVREIKSGLAVYGLRLKGE